MELLQFQGFSMVDDTRLELPFAQSDAPEMRYFLPDTAAFPPRAYAVQGRAVCMDFMRIRLNFRLTRLQSSSSLFVVSLFQKIADCL